MNARVCKRLRAKARDMTVGMPDRKIVGKTVYVKRAEKGVPCVAVNHSHTTRGVYLRLKREYRNRV